jgi:Flp pilus assembly protein protease CpaA
VGAGDLKLVMAFGLATHWHAGLFLSIHAIFWGAILGFVRVLISKEIFQLFRNIAQILMLKKPGELSLHKIPYTVGLFLGWLSYLKYEGYI